MYSHNHNCPGYPDSDFPVNCQPTPDNCGPTPPMGWDGKQCGERGAAGPARMERECSPVPPPIPPVRYVPGMNVQEQMTHMANHVNTCINRWNDIQRNCYEALDKVVGAAVNNDVYYAPDEVRFMEGYDEDSSCPYSIVEARAVDRAGKPIFCHLRAAYNNETNSGARELITDVSFVASAQMVMTAVQATESHWKGTTVFNCNPGASAPDDTVYVAGWNRNGVLRFFAGDVGEDILRQNRMVNCIGPVFPCLKDNQVFSEVVGAMGSEPGAVQAMGWKPNGNKVFFSCGVYDAPGMTPMGVTKILQRMGCKTAVITSYQTKAVTAWDTMPAAGTENVIPAGGSATDVISVPGMTGGMTFLGQLADAPIQWSIPQNCAAWVITKRPPRGWRNAFTTEIANVVQKLGNTENNMSSILGQLKNENDAIAKLEYNVTQNTNNISDLKVTVGGFDGRISDLETKMDTAETTISTLQTQLENEITLRDQQYTELKQADANETAERIAADNALKASIQNEVSARESADRILQNNIDEEASTRAAEDAKLKAEIDTEATTRANADRNLQAAIEAEQSARSTKDTQHEARMDAIEAKEQKDVEAINNKIESLESGESLPIATKSKLGVIRVGKNLTINEDGVLDAQAGGGAGDEIVEGAGIKIAENDKGQKVVSIDDSVVVNEDQLDATNNRVTALETKQADQAVKDQQQDEAIKTLTDGLATTNQNVVKNSEAIESATTAIQGIQNGSGLPIASADRLGAIKIGANLSMSEDGVLSAASGGEAGGETVAQGVGVTVTHDAETNVATVGLSTETQGKLAKIDTLETTIAGKADRSALEAVAADLASTKENFGNTQTEVESLSTQVATNASGISALNSSQVAQDKRIETAEQNVDACNTAITGLNEDVEKLRGDIEAIDDTATAALNTAADAEQVAAGKVSKAGDTMTGALTMNPGTGVVMKPDGTGLDVKIRNASSRIVADLPDGSRAQFAVGTPTASDSATTKKYVDDTVGAVTETAGNALNAAQAAQATANEAKAAVTGGPFLPTAGGTMSGDIDLTSAHIRKSTRNTVVFDNTAEYPWAAMRPIVDTTGPDEDHEYGLELVQIGSVSNDITTGLVQLRGIADPARDHDAANKAYVDSKSGGSYLPLSGGTLTGEIEVGRGTYTALNPNYFRGQKTGLSKTSFPALMLGADGRALTTKAFTASIGDTSLASNKNIVIRGVDDPIMGYDVANKDYVDNAVYPDYETLNISLSDGKNTLSGIMEVAGNDRRLTTKKKKITFLNLSVTSFSIGANTESIFVSTTVFPNYIMDLFAAGVWTAIGLDSTNVATIKFSDGKLTITAHNTSSEPKIISRVMYRV